MSHVSCNGGNEKETLTPILFTTWHFTYSYYSILTAVGSLLLSQSKDLLKAMSTLRDGMNTQAMQGHDNERRKLYPRTKDINSSIEKNWSHVAGYKIWKLFMHPLLPDRDISVCSKMPRHGKLSSLKLQKIVELSLP